MRPAILLLVPLLAFGCASTEGTPGSENLGPSTIAVGTDAGTVHITRHRDSRGAYYRIPGEPGEVWPILLEVHEELGIVRGTIDRGSWTVGNRQFSPPARLGGDRISDLIQCGSDAAGVPLATNARVEMSLITTLVPYGEDATRMETRIEATAQRRGVGASTVQCGTTGRLEARIAALTQLGVAVNFAGESQ